MVPRAVRRFRARVDAVVPVPVHPRTMRQRGYNQVEFLAHPVARALRVPMERRLLGRQGWAPPQVGAPRIARTQQLRTAFVAKPGPWPARVLLLDDVRTTGATMDAVRDAIAKVANVEVSHLVLAVTLAGP